MSLPSVSGSDSGLIVDHPPGSSPPQSPHMSSNASHGVGPPHGQGAPSQHRKSDAYSDPMSDNNDEIGSDLEVYAIFDLRIHIEWFELRLIGVKEVILLTLLRVHLAAIHCKNLP